MGIGKRLVVWVVAAMLGGLVALPGSPVSAADAEESSEPATLAAALAGGETKVTLRYRYELVSEDAFESDARASTLRTTLSYRTMAYRGWSLFLEAENVTGIGEQEAHRNAGAGDLSNGVSGRPTIADPEITEMNQALLSWQGRGVKLGLGRQEISLGTQRFVGPVGWRQNHQSFDGASVVVGDKAPLSYHYIDNVNRIFGDNKPMSSHLLAWRTPLGSRGAGLQLYGLLLDYNELADSVLSTNTYGVRYEQAWKSGGFGYALEYAQQRDAGDNPAEVDAAYYLGELRWGSKAISVTGGYEVLEGGDGGSRSFSTPLATLHKFNGWADKFLVTPPAGLEDIYVSLRGTAGSFSWAAIYHDFSAESGSQDYGSELDLLLSLKTGIGLTLALKGALYDADDFSTDTEKIMFWSSYSFGR